MTNVFGTQFNESVVKRHQYDAFISYSHKADSELARTLQVRLERWARPWFSARTAKLFRDQTSLTATPHLWTTIAESLDQSNFLILLASTDSATSAWVPKEIAYWLTEGKCDNPDDLKSDQVVKERVDRLMIVLTEGAIDWNHADGDFDWATTTALHPVLRKLPWQPLWTDLRWARGMKTKQIEANDRFTEPVLKLLSPIRNKTPQELMDANDKEQKRAVSLFRWLSFGLAFALMLAILGGEIVRRQRNAAIWRNSVSKAEILALDAMRVRNADSQSVNADDDHERALSLAMNAYEVHTKADGDAFQTIDRSLRTCLSNRYFGLTIKGHWRPACSRRAPRFVTHCLDGIGIWEQGEFRPNLIRTISYKAELLGISDDGKCIAATSGATIKRWSYDTSWRDLPDYAHPSKVTAFTFRPDSQAIIFGDSSGAMHALSHNTTSPDFVDQHHTTPIWQIVVGPKPPFLITGSQESLIIRPLDNPLAFTRLGFGSNPLSEFNQAIGIPNVALYENTIAYGRDTGVTLDTILDQIDKAPEILGDSRNLSERNASRFIRFGNNGGVLAADGGIAITPTMAHEIAIFEPESANSKNWVRMGLVRSLSGAWDAAFLNDDRCLLTTHGTNDGSVDSYIRVWNLRSVLPKQRPRKKIPRVPSIDVSGRSISALGVNDSSGHFVVSEGFHENAHATILKTPKIDQWIPIDLSIAVFSDEKSPKMVLASGNDVHLFAIEDNKPAATELTSLGIPGAKAVSFIDSGRTLRVAGIGKIVDIQCQYPFSRKVVATLPRDALFRRAGAFCRNGEILAVSADSDVRLFQLPSLEPIAVLADPVLTSDVNLICFSSTADQVAVATNTNLSIWSLKYPYSLPITHPIDNLGWTMYFWDEDRWLVYAKKFGGSVAIPTTKQLYETGIEILKGEPQKVVAPRKDE